VRAKRLERLLDTPARIWFKYEGVSPAGSHKPNTAVPQAYYNAQEGVRRITTETGAGQWGSALAFATAQFGIECEVWQVAASFRQKPYRASMMRTWGATVHSSPSNETAAGRAVLAQDPDSPARSGSRSRRRSRPRSATSTPVRARQRAQPRPAPPDRDRRGGAQAVRQDRGHTGPDRGLHRWGLELRRADVPVPPGEARGPIDPRILAVEPASCPSLTKGEYRYDFGDLAGMTPLLKMHTLGHDFIPDPIHAGGLRYHGMSPLISHIYELGLFEAEAVPQSACFDAGVRFARTEGIIPAPEPTHAIAAAIREAERCRETGEEKAILTAVCGHGHFDMAAYDAYFDGELIDYEYPTERIADAMARVPVIG
jgi:tryptophan synthase beta chain